MYPPPMRRLEPRSPSFQAPRSALPMRVRPARPLGDDELYALCRANADLRIERSHDGELIVAAPTGGDTGHRNFALIARLAAWAEADGSGLGFGSSTGFSLPNGAERSPDCAWIERRRWDALTAAQRSRFVPLVPDFVLELRSHDDALEDLQTKMNEYLAQGARLGWLLDPSDRSVWIYRPAATVERLVDPALVPGDPVLPGFVLRLAGIW